MDLEDYLQESANAMNSIHQFFEPITILAEEITRRLLKGGAVYWFGNGGSAGDAQHLATELVGKFAKNRKPIKSHSLGVNTSLITALGNDNGFETIFSRQIEAFVGENDVAIGISTSGSSKNVLSALKEARDRRALVVGFTGQDENEMDNLCDFVFHAPSKTTGVIQQIHITVGQALCLVLENGIK